MVQSGRPPTAAIFSDGSAFQREINRTLNTRYRFGRIGNRDCDGEIRQTHITDRLRLADLRFTPHSMEPQPGLKRGGRNPVYFLAIQLEGDIMVRQGGREIAVGPGDIYMVNTSRPYYIETQDSWQRSTYLDPDIWHEVFPERDHYTAMTLASDTGLGRVCRELIFELFDAAPTQSQAQTLRIATSLAHAFAASIVAGAPDYHPARTHEEVFLERVKQYVRENLADPELDCAAIARHLNLSVRHVHQLFAQNEVTLMRFVWLERLKRIARDLQNPALTQRSVSSLAFDWGFSDAAHFSRSFAARFGMSPTAFRRAGLREATLPH